MKQEANNLLDVVRKHNYIILDTETTGLKNAEICEIAIINNKGEILLDTLVKPKKSIPKQAWAIHGITDTSVKNASGWESVRIVLYDILSEYENLVVYNAKFDRHMIYSSDEHIGVKEQGWKSLLDWHCAMEAYAEFHGDWNQYHQSFRWQKLGDAVTQMKIPPSNLHSALGDCKMTLELVQAMIA